MFRIFATKIIFCFIFEFQVKEQVEARNELESYAYSLKNQIGDKDKLGGKLDSSDKKEIESALDDAISWLESHRVIFTFMLRRRNGNNKLTLL